MVFYVAAAHGFDPHHPMRPAELLALLDLYTPPTEARARSDGVGSTWPMAAAEQALRGTRTTTASTLGSRDTSAGA